MGPKIYGRKAFALLAILLPTLVITACLNAEPKILGQQGKFDFSAFNGSGVQGQFLFNYALQSGTTVGVQGSTNSKSAIIGTCNLNGTSCMCQFLAADGTTVLGSTNSSQILYDESGNYFNCTVPGGVTIPTNGQIRVSNLDGSVVSTAMAISSSLTVGQLIGSDLDANHVRTVYRYQCEYNYLQKAGTSALSFDCSNQVTSCDPDNDSSKSFCMLKARFPFFLYSDSFSNNFASKIADKLYAGGGGTNTICGDEIKQVNCVESDTDSTDAFGTPVKQFGLYSQATGIWQQAVSLPSGPDQPSSSFGYAAAVSTTAGNVGNCPPGLIKRIFFTSTIVTTDITPSNNFPSGLIATEVADPTITPVPFHIGKLSGPGGVLGGSCDGAKCYLPQSTVVAGAKPDQNYTSTGQTAFCVIPGSML
ncbi:MAG: hypothetical protein ACXVCS_20550 [Bdellovibrionota bacterium]